MKKKKKKEKKKEMRRKLVSNCQTFCGAPGYIKVETCQTDPLAMSGQEQWLPQLESSYREGLTYYEAHH